MKKFTIAPRSLRHLAHRRFDRWPMPAQSVFHDYTPNEQARTGEAFTDAGLRPSRAVLKAHPGPGGKSGGADRSRPPVAGFAKTRNRFAPMQRMNCGRRNDSQKISRSRDDPVTVARAIDAGHHWRPRGAAMKHIADAAWTRYIRPR